MGELQSEALLQRGLDPDLTAERGWHACSGPSSGLWIGIPYFDQGKRVGTKRRTIRGDKRFYQDAGSHQIFWNVDCLRDQTLKDEPLIITEGELDAEVAIEAGFPRTVSVPGGAPSEPDTEGDGARWHYLEHAAELLKDVRNIILAVDADPPGGYLQAGLIERLGAHRCRLVTYPTGKDLNDVLVGLGQGAVRDVLTTATWKHATGFYARLRDIPEVPRPVPINVGIVGLDQHYRMRRGDLCVITGAPGHGKSSFINNVVCNVVSSYRLNACFASFEQHPTLDHRRALRTYFGRKLEVQMSDVERHDADRWIDAHFSFIWPEENDVTTLPWLMQRFAMAVIQCNAAICVLDPWNEIDYSDRPKEWTGTEYVHHSLRLMKKFAREYNIALIVAAHPAKLQRAKDGKVPRPGMYDIAESAAWANRADVGLVIHRPDMMVNSETEIAVVKSRFFSQIGRPGIVKGMWDEATTRYTIVDDGAGMHG